MINFFDFINESILGKKLDDFLSSFPFSNNTIIVFDVETTGFNPRLPHVQITELSAIPVDLKTGDLGDPFVRNIKLNSETLKKMEHEKENPVVQKSRVMSSFNHTILSRPHMMKWMLLLILRIMLSHIQM